MRSSSELRRALAGEMARLDAGPGLERRLLHGAFASPSPPAAPARQAAFAVSWRALELLGAALVVVLFGSTLFAGRLLAGPSSHAGSAQLTPAEMTQLHNLEARPLHLPPPPAPGGDCPITHSVVTPYRGGMPVPFYGSDPVYGLGGASLDGAAGTYFDATYVTAPAASGVLLIRGADLSGGRRVLFTGRYAAGPVVGTDTLAGATIELHSEAVLPLSRPPRDPTVKPGWAVWLVRQGIAHAPAACVGLQMDWAAGTEATGIGLA